MMKLIETKISEATVHMRYADNPDVTDFYSVGCRFESCWDRQ
jgi:hypothetical protein